MRAILTASEQKHEKEDGCNIYKNIRQSRNTSFLGITGYEGIPQNFLLNVASWLVMFMLFTVMRKKVWNYGRIAVMQKEEMEWTNMFYEDHELHIDENSTILEPAPVVITSAKSIFIPTNEVSKAPISPIGQLSIPENFGEEIQHADNNETSRDKGFQRNPTAKVSQSHPKVRVHEIQDRGYFSWIKITFDLTDEQLREKCGQDCVHYLSFQRHLIVLVSIITVLSMVIILPINFHKSIQKNEYSGFADTTIINLDNEYTFLWAHVILANSFLIISVIVMRRFSKRLHFSSKDSCDLSRTVIIVGLSKKNCREDYLRTHFEEAYPGTEVSEVSFAYNIGKLHDAELKRLGAVSAKRYHRAMLEGKHHNQRESTRARPKIRPQLCGIWDCRCCKETDAIDYYSEREQRYTQRVNLEKERAMKEPLGIAFVTFKTVDSATKIVENSGCIARGFLHPPVSKYSKRLNSNDWSVKYAPPPQEIYWENLSVNITFWYVKFFTVNVLLGGLVIIFTTPVYLFTTFAGPGIVKHKTHGHENITSSNGTTQIVDVEQITVLVSLVIDTLPSIIVCTLGVTLVVVVSQSDIIIGFWSRTAGIYSEMVKTFFFLTFMVIALPSLGVTSFSYFLDNGHSLEWSCIFYKENGALFVNYLITASLIGTGAELMRLPELFLFLVKVCFAQSKAEIGAIRKSILFEFPIGSFYAWIMLEFAILACFCVIYPLVTPFGLLYHCLKYWTDRYNIYFAYSPCKVNKTVHRTAINFVMISMFMLQINLIAYVHFHLGEKQNQQVDFEKAKDPKIRTLQIFTLLTFSLASSIYIGQACCDVGGDFSPYFHHDKILDFEADDKKDSNDPQKNRNSVDSDEDSYEDDSSEDISNHSMDNLPTPPIAQGNSEVATPMVRGNTEASPATGAAPDSSAKKPYGRFIPRVLRSEFIRLHQNSHSSP